MKSLAIEDIENNKYMQLLDIEDIENLDHNAYTFACDVSYRLPWTGKNYWDYYKKYRINVMNIVSSGFLQDTIEKYKSDAYHDVYHLRGSAIKFVLVQYALKHSKVRLINSSIIPVVENIDYPDKNLFVAQVWYLLLKELKHEIVRSIRAEDFSLQGLTNWLNNNYSKFVLYFKTMCLLNTMDNTFIVSCDKCENCEKLNLRYTYNPELFVPIILVYFEDEIHTFHPNAIKQLAKYDTCNLLKKTENKDIVMTE